MPAVTIEEIIAEQSRAVCDQIAAAAAFAASEEDLRIGVHAALREFEKAAKIGLEGHHEVSLGRGRADSVYSHVVVEYKKPGRLADSNDAPGNREVLGQLRDRLKTLEREEGRRIERLFGVGCDGNRFVFVRYRNGAWEASAPAPRTPQTMERFLRALTTLASKGRAFQPEYLAGDFGSEAPLAREGIETFYRAIRHTTNPRATVLFKEWDLHFGQIGGYDVKSLSDKVKKLADFYGITGTPNAQALLFSVHTYYALFMKLLAAEIMNFFNPMVPSVLNRFNEAPSGAALRRQLDELEKGGIYKQLNITNFLEGDLFSWYVNAWETRDSKGKVIDVENVVRQMVARLDDYDPVTLSVEPTQSRDLLKRLYQDLFPKSVRHDLGEYYTPDWLADHVLNQVEYDGDPDKRVLDPACGSGTFLVLALQRIRQFAEERMLAPETLLAKILDNVIGFDLNPLAVMAARLNYLIAIRDLVKYGGEVRLPVYLCDSIMTPAEYGDLFTGGGLGKVQELRTSAKKFAIPTEVARPREVIERYADQLDACVTNDYSPDEFLERLREEGLPCAEEDLHRRLFEQLAELKRDDKNGVWARIIKNSFAPLFVGRVDYVVGNPPWVNWESLPGDYRDSTKKLWTQYGLYTLSASAARLGGGKKDLAMLFVYTGVDRYLVDGGKLGFVITQSVFKTKGAGDGFRRFRYPVGSNGEEQLGVIRVDDLSALQPFEGATNRTAVLACVKGQPTVYPVPYVAWERTGAFHADHPLAEVLSSTRRVELCAQPVETLSPTSPWSTAAASVLRSMAKVTGQAAYRGLAGSCTWLNGVYWVKVLERQPNELLLIENLHEVGKISVPNVTRSLEPDLVYPLLRGRDVSRWRAEPSAHLLLTQDPATRAPYPEAQMKRQWRRTHEYLKLFEKELRGRSGLKRYFDPAVDPFYAMYNVGPYTVAPYKVVWREQASQMTAAVVTPVDGRPVVPDHKLMLVAAEGEPEAHFICALLNSGPATATVKSYVVETQTTTHVLQHVAIARFSARDGLHRRLSELSRRAHELTAAGDADGVASLEAEIDQAAAELWGLTGRELAVIQESLGRTRASGRRTVPRQAAASA
jgi:SAM-dependent methyltransferase